MPEDSFFVFFVPDTESFEVILQPEEEHLIIKDARRATKDQFLSVLDERGYGFSKKLKTRVATLLESPLAGQTIVVTNSEGTDDVTFPAFDHLVLPQLPTAVGASSGPSLSRRHDRAQISAGIFGSLKLQIPADVFDGIWRLKTTKQLESWSSEACVAGFVKTVLVDVIGAYGLGDTISCVSELSLFDLRPDMWLVTKSGIPLGVVEVKKPGVLMEVVSSENAAGQLYDYMLRVRSFYGVRIVFGILTTYESWRIFWFPDDDSQKLAAFTELPEEINGQSNQAQPTHESDVPDDEIQLESDASSSRSLSASKILRWDSLELAPTLGSVMKKMILSPRDKVQTFSSNRHYVVLEEKAWKWMKVKKAVPLKYPDNVSAGSKFILLQDMRAGFDGRVWLACTPKGNAHVLKFPRLNLKREDSEVDAKERLEHEAAMHQQLGYSSRVCTLSEKSVLIIPYYEPIDFGHLTTAHKNAITAALECMVEQKKLYHGDMKPVHVVKVRDRELSSENIRFIDLVQVRNVGETEDCKQLIKDMLNKLW